MFNATPTADLSVIASLNNNPVYNQHDIRTSPRLRAARGASEKCCGVVVPKKKDQHSPGRAGVYYPMITSREASAHTLFFSSTLLRARRRPDTLEVQQSYLISC